MGQPVSLLCCSVCGRAQRGQCCCLASGVLLRGKLSPHSRFPFSQHATGVLPAVALVRNPRGGGFCMSPKSISSPLRGHSFFHHPNPHWFLQPEVMGTFLPGTGTLGWVVWTGAGLPPSQGIPPDFYPPHVELPIPIYAPLASPPLCPSYPSE